MDAATLKSRFAEFNLDPALAEAVEAAPASQILEGILRLEDPRQIPPQFTLVSQFIRICTGRFLASDSWSIRLHPNVVSLKAARSMGIYGCCNNLPESIPESMETEEIFPRTNRGLPSTGHGCMVAALDFGLDFAHPNFVKPDGATRLTAFWNQGATYDAAHPNRYGYGRVFSRDEIDDALRASDPYRALGYHPAISDTGHGSHGTHTLDIAAGNGRARGSNVGVAPDADLLFVHLSTPNLGSGDLGDSVRMLEALDFVQRTAQDRPWVVNLSVGRTAGSHDGTSPFEQGMHELLRLGTGRAIVQSAGNYRAADLAVEGWLRDGERRDLEWIIDPRDTTSNEIDSWYSGNDRFTVALRPPEGGEFVEVALGEVADVEHNGSLVGRIYHRKNDPNNRDNHIQVFLYPNAPSGVWTLRLTGEYVINGRFHAWIERAQATPGAQSRFDRNITSQSYTLGTIATSPLVITVGAYDAHAEGGPLAPFSSCGPTRDERHDKPELAAPGVNVVAARSIPRGAVQQEGLLIPRSGTSMAAPHVTGCVAAMFDAAGRPVSIQEIRDCLKRTAEPMTDEERPGCCAWGRLNIAEAIGRMRDLNCPEFSNTPQSVSGRWLGTSGPPASDAIALDIKGLIGQDIEGLLIAEDIEDLPEQQKIQVPLDKGLPMTFDTDRFLDRAEQALRNSNAGRLQSETSFLQHLMRELGGRVVAPGLSPASLFRAAVKDSSLMQSVQDLLTIVALPSQQPETPLRAGDWMVRVVSGTGDVGHISILASADLLPPSALAYERIAAEGTQPGYYGIVVESGAFPHSRTESFARRFLDARGRVPAHTVILRPQPEESDASEEYKPPSWLKIERRNPGRPREPYLDFDAADSTTANTTANEGEDQHALQENFDPATVPKTVADALANKDWPRALALAIQAGWHDENDLTDLLFFTRHPELPIGTLDQKVPKYTQLSAEWSAILSQEARPAIETASEDTTLKVSGKYVAERDRQFWGKTGKKFRELVQWAANEVDINPGLLAAVLLAEWDQSSLYLSSEPVPSFQSGSDDFFEARAQLAANVPAFSKVHFDITKKFTNTNEHGRVVTTIPFDSGKDAALATAVYLKYAEIKLRKGAAKNGGDFDKLPAETRFALVRIAMAAGHGGIDTDGTLLRFKWTGKQWAPVGKGETGGVLVGVASYLETVLAGKDILVRKNEPRGDPSSSGHITSRNATILTAQALHLSDWIFGKPQAAPAAVRPSGVQPSEAWSEPQEADPDKFTPPSWLKVERRTQTRSGQAEAVDTEDFTFDPTGEQTDFGPKLRAAWHAMIQTTFKWNIDRVTQKIVTGLGIAVPDAAKQVRFFSPASDPPSITLTGANVNWRAFPRSFGSATPKGYKLIDEPRLFHTDEFGDEILRGQDEYCEWLVFLDTAAKKILRVVFTSEPPEYYSFLYDPGVPSLQKRSRELLVQLYQERCGDKSVTLADLEKTNLVTSKTVYYRGNKWNNQYCVHLQQPANTLGAQINIAARAAVVRSDSKGALITDVKALINCDGFGVAARQSDPFIGDNVNKLARENRFVTLENPVGLYMTSLDTKGWKTPDGTDAQSFWKVLKGKTDKDPGKSMIVRAEFAVPAARGYTVSDIKIGGIPIEFGGQIAEHLEMRLGALFGPKDTGLKGGKLAPPTPLVCP